MKTTFVILAAAVVAIAIVAAILAMGGNTGGYGSTPTSPTTAVTTVTSPTTTTATQNTVVTQTTTQAVTQTATQGVTQTTTVALSGSITGAGATFPLPQIQQWANDFRDYTGGRVTVNYQGVGSGAGQSNFLQKKIDFAGSDVPLTPQNYEKVKGRIYQFPEVVGSIVIAYNVPEIAYAKTRKYLNLTAEVVALIYMGDITYWDDPRIKALNPGLANLLPHKEITAVHRADGSGTTAYFTLWLAKAYQRWNSTVGWGLAVQWPVDKLGRGVGGQGNPGVASAVQNTPYSIGYIEYAYYALNKEKFDSIGGVAYVRNDNDGKYYFATPEMVQLGIKSALERYKQKYGAFPSPEADWNYVIKEMSNPPNGYPLSAFSFFVVWKDYASEGYPDAATKAALVRAFMSWVLTQGQKDMVPGYLPLPPELQQIGLEAVNSIKP